MKFTFAQFLIFSRTEKGKYRNDELLRLLDLAAFIILINMIQRSLLN